MATGYQRGIYISSILLIISSLASCTFAICALLLGTNSFGFETFFGLPFGYQVGGFFIAATLVAAAQAIYQFIVGCMGVKRYDSLDEVTTLWTNGIIVFITALLALVFMLFCLGGGPGSVPVMGSVVVLIVSSIVSAVFLYSTGRLHGGTRFPDVY